MILIAKNTEQILLRDFDKIVKSGGAPTCFYIHLSHAKTGKDEWFPVFTKAMQQVEGTEQAQIYICHDQDLFILMPSLTDDGFSQILRSMSENLKTDKLYELAGKFDLEEDWEKFEILCRKKIHSYKEVFSKTRPPHRSKDKQLVELDADLIRSIPSRRKNTSLAHIMVVDDDEISRMLVQKALGNEFTVSVAGDGREAIENYVLRAPHVLFLDIGLPDMPGHQVLENIFQIDSEAYVVMFSARRDEKNVHRALDIGAQGYITKPFSKNKLLQYVKRCPHITEEKQKRIFL